jgi:hypothetical protein
VTTAAPAARRELELSGTAIRRTTRRAAAARAETTLWTRIGDTLGTATSVGVGIAVVGGGLASLRKKIAATPLTVHGAPLPPAFAAAVAAVLAVAGLLLVLDRLGPVSSTPAAAAWWLPLPADRRGLLAGDLARTCGAVVGTALVLVIPVAFALPSSPTAGGVLTSLGLAVALAGAAVGGTALLQTRGLGGRLGGLAGAVAVLAAVAAAVAGTAGALGVRIPSLSHLPAPPLWTTAVVALVAALLLAGAFLGLQRLDAGRLRASGVTTQFATASFFSLDTRDLGRALSSRPRVPRRSRRFRRVHGPVAALVARDLVVLARGRWQLGQLVTALAVPVLVARTAGLGDLPVAVWLGCVLGWSLVAIAAGHPGREAQAAPELDRLLPLSAVEVLRARLLVPVALSAVVCTATGLLIGLGTGAVALWALLGLAVAPGWAAAALRGAFRPEPDWAGTVMATPFGPSPVGVGARLVQGPDVGIVSSLPVLVALLRGAPTGELVAVQLLLSVVLAAGAVALLAHRQGKRP